MGNWQREGEREGNYEQTRTERTTAREKHEGTDWRAGGRGVARASRGIMRARQRGECGEI